MVAVSSVPNCIPISFCTARCSLYTHDKTVDNMMWACARPRSRGNAVDVVYIGCNTPLPFLKWKLPLLRRMPTGCHPCWQFMSLRSRLPANFILSKLTRSKHRNCHPSQQWMADHITIRKQFMSQLYLSCSKHMNCHPSQPWMAGHITMPKTVRVTTVPNR